MKLRWHLRKLLGRIIEATTWSHVGVRYDERSNVWVSHYWPLNICSQGRTRPEAISALQSAVNMTVKHSARWIGQEPD